MQALKIFGVTQQEIDDAQHQGVAINPQLAVRSPIAGVVVQKLVTPGLVIQAGTTACFTISDVSTVWVQGHIYDRDLEVGSRRRRGRGDQFVVSTGLPRRRCPTSERWSIRRRAPLPVRIVTQNPQGLLKKDMFVDAVIHTRSGRSVARRADFGDSSQRRKSAVCLCGSVSPENSRSGW